MGSPSNVFFLDLPIEHSGGGAFVQIVVDEGYTPLVSKVDLADYFHTILARPTVRRYFGLRPVRAERLAALGIHVSPEHIDADGWTHPRCATCRWVGSRLLRSRKQATNACFMDRLARGRRRLARLK